MRALALAALIIAIIAPMGLYFTAFLPVEVQYSNLFNNHYLAAKAAVSFEGTDQQIMTFWTQMNTTFGTQNHDQIYDSPFYWDHVYIHSLASIDAFLGQLHARAIGYEDQYISIKQSVGSAQGVADWYDKAITDMTSAVKQGPWGWSSFSDVVHEAYMLNIHPNIYWLGWDAWLIFYFGLISTGVSILLYLHFNSYNYIHHAEHN